MYSTPQIFRYAYRSIVMRYIVFNKEYLQDKKRIMKIGAVEVPELKTGTHIVQVRGEITSFCTVPPLLSKLYT